MRSTIFPLFLHEIRRLRAFAPADLRRFCTSNVPDAVPRRPRLQVANDLQSGYSADQTNSGLAASR